MKGILYMAMSANGFIADQNDQADWVSPEDWQGYTDFMHTQSAAIIGRRTYEIARADEFAPNCTYYVITSHSLSEKKSEKIVEWRGSIEELWQRLEGQNHQSVAIVGGSKINALCLDAGIISEAFLYIEPTFLPSGINLAAELNKRHALTLQSCEKINDNTVRLHYLVA